MATHPDKTTHINQQKELNSTSNKWELFCEAYLTLGMADEEKDYPRQGAYEKAVDFTYLAFKIAF